MKRTLVPLLLCFAAATLPVAAQQSSLLSQAQRAYMAGDVATAKPLFEKVLADDPQNIAARNFLKAIVAAEAEVGPGAKMEKQLQKLILPKVEFKDATFDSVLEALRQMAAKASDGKLTPSFVIQPGVNVSAPVTLRLNNIPFTEVVRYVCTLANAEFVVDRYAIMVKPKTASTAAPAQ